MSDEPRVEIGLLDHLQVPAADVAAAVAFYRDVLGATVQSVSPRWAMVRLANVDVGIHAAGGSAGWEPGFRVADIAAVKRGLKAAGVAITRDYHDIPGGVTLAFRDPDGNPVAVYQYGVSVEELRGA